MKILKEGRVSVNVQTELYLPTSPVNAQGAGTPVTHLHIPSAFTLGLAHKKGSGNVC